ncbi:MAG: ATP-dependent DNA ligase [Acidobacteriota bacterium]
MKAFTDLFARLDETTRTNEKIAALADYFRSAPARDAAWAVHFLSGNRPKRLVKTRLLREWVSAETGTPEWLLEECYEAVGDLAETLALLLPAAERPSDCPLHRWVEERLLPLAGLGDEAQRERMVAAWRQLGEQQIFVWHKLITGAFRVGVSRRLVVRGLSQASGVDDATLSHRLMGSWQPTAEAYRALLSPDTRDAEVSRPYPFCLAHPLEAAVDELALSLGPVDDWIAEWKWDGIRSQVIRRQGLTFIWSRGEEPIAERFPELEVAASGLPDGTVLDGEILPWGDDGVMPFAQLQRRIGRKKLGPKILSEVPVVLVAYDLLEEGGEDLRALPFAERRRRLKALIADRGGEVLRLSATVESASWEELAARRETARRERAEGLMLKRRESSYRVGRKKGDWWKWKVDPYTVDAVMIYAQRGHGRRASQYTDYTFGVWDGDALVPFAKAYSGLTDAEIRKVDRFVRRNTLERFGPVRSVKAELVFELAFEGIRASSRHKSGVAVRFPRMARWRTDKQPADADTLETVKALLPASEGGEGP